MTMIDRHTTVDRSIAAWELCPAQWIYPGRLADVAEARNAVVDHVAAVEGIDLAAVRLVVGELVANAVEHARTSFTVRAEPGHGYVRIEVADLAVEQPVVRTLDPFAFDGRGLHLVRGLAERWGSRPTFAGKVVWADLALG